MTIITETSRLLLRHFEPSDAEFVRRLVNEPSWLEHIGDRGVRSAEDALRYIQTARGQEEKFGFGMDVIERKADAAPIGVCGLVQRDVLPDPDLGFALLPEAWGVGYAFEAASAVLGHARDVLGKPRLFAVVAPTNERSIRLLEKLGFGLVGPVRLAPDDEELKLYTTTPEGPAPEAGGRRFGSP